MKRILFQGDSITDASRNREALPESNNGFGAGYPGLVAARIFGDHLGNEYNNEKMQNPNLAAFSR